LRQVANRHRTGRRPTSWGHGRIPRDRRKDALLQENGYLVLRFLAEDVGKYLDQVLDAILRALSHQDART
jgi:very-short-patch-repair endonuclease